MTYRSEGTESRRGIPRWLDATAAAALLVAGAPLLAVTAAAIRLSSPGPILFRQRRVGLRGRPFTLLKFRTMKTGNAGLQVTATDDPRITRTGRFLRKSKLDELPELWNVLRGDMALVGPRPEVPAYVDLGDPRWEAVLHARPGLTDPVTSALRSEEELLASVEGDRDRFYRSELLPRKLDGYLDYLRRRTIRSDIAVLWNTLLAICGLRAADAAVVLPEELRTQPTRSQRDR